MPLVLMGTHTLAQTTIILPRPGWNESTNLNVHVDWDQMMDGTIYSYVTGTTERPFTLDLLLSEDKAEELIRFFKIYSTTVNRMYYIDDTVWSFRFLKPDLTFTTQTPSNLKQVTLELLARKL